nr:hypothetical protein [Tanacetum cinerariifolium]
STVCDDASGLEVGKRRCLVYCDVINKKSQWLMHEDTTIDLNIPADNFSYNYKEVCELDYADSLNSGYRFSATDSEIIVYYLQRKIETGEQHPECRYYIADFYGDTPDNLS